MKLYLGITFVLIAMFMINSYSEYASTEHSHGGMTHSHLGGGFNHGHSGILQ